MAVQRASVERKSAPLHSEFGREFLTRRFGERHAKLILSLVPLYTRGPRKGLAKGYIHWDKVTVGGWRHDSAGRGHVERPGTRNVRVREDWFGDKIGGYEILETRRWENETDEERDAYIRELLGLMFGKSSPWKGRVPAKLVERASEVTNPSL